MGIYSPLTVFNKLKIWGGIKAGKVDNSKLKEKKLRKSVSWANRLVFAKTDSVFNIKKKMMIFIRFVLADLLCSEASQNGI